MEKNIKEKKNEVESSIDIIQLWRLFMNNLKWIPISLVVCLVIGAIYIWFTPTTVGITGKMEVIDKSKNGSSGISTSMALLNSLPLNLGSNLGGSVSFGIDSEKEILLSTSLVRNVVKELETYTEYRLSKWGRNTLLYGNNPIKVSLDSAHVQWLDEELPLTTHQIQLTVTKSSSGYKVKTKVKENKEKTNLPTRTFTSLPATIETEAGTLTITDNILTPKQAKAFENGYTLKITISPPTNVARGFISRLSAAPPKSVNNMLNITLQDENVIRGINFVSGLVEAYNQRANDEKNEEARKTDEFVNTRLAKIDMELGSSDDDWENSKKQYQITTPEVDAQEALAKKSQYEAQLVELGSRIQLHDYLSDYIDEPDNIFELIPIGMLEGSSDSQGATGETGTASFIAQHNAMVKQRNDLMKSVSERSPRLQRLTESIKELHPTIQLAMKRDREQLVMQKNTLEREYARYSGRIGTVPQMERVFTEIGRQREIKQAVYLLLLQKREETAMELVNTTNKGRLIDDVMVDTASTRPQKKMVLLISLLAGGVLPLSFLFIIQIFKRRIDTREEIEALVKYPFLAEIPSINYEEAFRNLRTHLLLNLRPGKNTLLITSHNSGEGKTFIAQHLVDSFNTIGKKALYVDADLRKKDNVFPADVLASVNFAQQLDQAKTANDYVIIDTPAIGQYADALQLAQFADATLYVIKSGSTKKTDVEALQKKTCLPLPMIILNNTNLKK